MAIVTARASASRSWRAATCWNSRSIEKTCDVERADAVLVPREIEQIADDAIETPRLLGDRVEVTGAPLGVSGDLRHLQRFDVGADRRQRRLELVGDVGEHLPPQPIGRAQRLLAHSELVRPSG